MDLAIATIKRLMRDDEAPAAVQLAAAREILDRVVGKPRQAIEVKHEDEKAPQVVIYIPDNGRDRGEVQDS